MRNETLSSMARNIPSSWASIRRCPPKYTTRGSKNVNLCLRYYAFTIKKLQHIIPIIFSLSICVWLKLPYRANTSEVVYFKSANILFWHFSMI